MSCKSSESAPKLIRNATSFFLRTFEKNEEAARRPMTMWQSLEANLLSLFKIAIAVGPRINWFNLLVDDAIAE